MERQGTPGPATRSSSKTGRSDPQLWGGTAFILGIVALIAGLAYLVLGNTTMAEVSLLAGVVLLVAGFAVSRLGR